MSEKQHRCSQIIDYVRNYGCSRYAKVERDGRWFCGQHDPVAAKARRAAQDVKWKAESAERARLRAEAAQKQAHAEMCVRFHERLVNALKLAIVNEKIAAYYLQKHGIETTAISVAHDAQAHEALLSEIEKG